ncbi:hypothetical protein Q9L58_003636 [Maublancomyces gigas]|uniref:Uncharacterized protein n=1 Tax=Discina gigas TaxID=1032678 RepID=A0ABR3GMZ6_9PEZI
MPWQSKRQRRELIAAAVKPLRDDTITIPREISCDLQHVNTHVGDLTTSLASVQVSMQKLELYSANETKKLAAVVGERKELCQFPEEVCRRDIACQEGDSETRRVYEKNGNTTTEEY